MGSMRPAGAPLPAYLTDLRVQDALESLEAAAPKPARAAADAALR